MVRACSCDELQGTRSRSDLLSPATPRAFARCLTPRFATGGRTSASSSASRCFPRRNGTSSSSSTRRRTCSSSRWTRQMRSTDASRLSQSGGLAGAPPYRPQRHHDLHEDHGDQEQRAARHRILRPWDRGEEQGQVREVEANDDRQQCPTSVEDSPAQNAVAQLEQKSQERPSTVELPPSEEKPKCASLRTETTSVATVVRPR